MATTAILDDIRRLQRTYKLFVPGTVVVAVSGGIDSMVLLNCLDELREEFQIKLHVATLDHRIRGLTGAADAQFVVDVARELDFPVTYEQIDVPALRQDGENLEAVARRERYAFLQRVARQAGASTLVTAHHLDDQAETILFHVLRGTGLAGLRGMMAKSALGGDLTLVRPLLETSRQQIEDYAAQAGIIARHDHTNDDLSYTRNYLRHEIMPRLAQVNPAFREALHRLGQIAHDEHSFLLNMLPTLDADRSIDHAEFLQLQPIQQQALILEGLRQVATGLDVEHSTVQRVVEDIKAGRRDSLFIHVRGKRIYFATLPAYPQSLPHLQRGAVVALGAMLLDGWKLMRTPAAHIPADDQLIATLRLPDDAMIQVRTPQRGDRFQPRGMGGRSQKLSDLFINLKVPMEWRAQVPLVTVNGEIAWLVIPQQDRFISRISERFAPRKEEPLEGLASLYFVKL